MRTKAERRKSTYKHIRKNYKEKSIYSKFHGKEEEQPHRLYKGNNFTKKQGRLAIKPKTKKDLVDEITEREMLNEDEID